MQWCYVCQYKYYYIQLFIHYHGETTNPATTPWLLWKEPPAQYKVIALHEYLFIKYCLTDRYKFGQIKIRIQVSE